MIFLPVLFQSYGDRARVTPIEWRYKVRPQLSSMGWTHHQLDQAELAFHEALGGNPELPSWKRGVDRTQLEETLGYMKKHPGVTAIAPHHWEQLEEVMQRHIDPH